MKIKNLKGRTLSFFLCFIVIFNFMSVAVFAVQIIGNHTAVYDGQLTFDNATVPYTKSLKSNGDKTYTYQLALNAINASQDSSTSSIVTSDGWYTAKYAGTYLVEVWGGNGGNGKDTNFANGGVGGKGGYVYGLVNLNVGDVLYYTIGGNGSTVLPSGSGGASGGGTHGDSGSHEIGSGGGYSAVFQYKGADFESAYLDNAHEMTSDGISESDRLSRVVLIAGGGGGGGCGDDFTIGYTPSPTGSRGGDGGNILTSPSGEVGDTGVFYAGMDGFSSGETTDYVGLGGTNVPGEGRLTNGESYTSMPGKMWADGGNGGDGNLRGGAGGAGYAGGSGGISKALMSAYDIGGGGGASSFVSSSLSTNLTDAERELLTPGGINPDDSEGGSVKIKYVANKNTESNIDYLSDIQIDFDFSDYFEIISYSIDGTATANKTQSSLSINNAVLHDAVEGKTLTIDIVFKPKDGFPGGNDVPVFNNNEITFITGDDSVFKISTDGYDGYINVPYAFKAIGNSCSYDLSTDTPVPVNGTDLYTENTVYINAKANAGSGLYKFIQSVTDYKVDGGSPQQSYAPLIATQYNVSFDVTPVRSQGKASIGDPLIPTTFSAVAVISIIRSASDVINGNDFMYKKTISYNETTKKYTVKLSANMFVDSPFIDENRRIGITPQTFSSSGSYTVPETGIYLIQSWGGKGGNGGESYNGNQAGGTGAAGGYVYTVVKLNKNQVLNVKVGTNGVDGLKSQTAETGRGQGGGGGTCSYVQVSNTAAYLLVSGGGGGGGGATNRGLGILQTHGEKGKSAAANTAINSAETISTINENNYNGTTGLTGDNQNGGAAGTSGANYKNISVFESVYDDYTSQSVSEISAASSATNPNTTSGAVVISPLDKRVLSLKVNQLDEISYQFSKYFNVSGSPRVSLGNGTCGNITTDNNAKTLKIVNIAPEGCGEYINGTREVPLNFTVEVDFVPIDGFLGGNDVPLLTGIVVKQNDSNNDNSDDSVVIAANNATDFVNVEIPNNLALSTTDKTYVAGDTPYTINDVASYTVPNSESPYNDFVNVTTQPECSPAFNGAPTIDTTYALEVSISPKNTASKASVSSPVSEISVQKNVTINVLSSINYNLSHISSSDYSGTRIPIETGKAYKTILVPDKNYKLPENITVTINGENFTGFSYDSYTGEFEIPASCINGEVVIEAIADKPIVYYYVYYIHQVSPYNPDATETHTDRYLAEDEITDWTKTFTPAEFHGFHFVWDSVPSVMPSQNVWVTGSYSPNKYNLTIHYYENGTTNKLAPDYTKDMYFSTSFSVISPEIDGYSVDLTTVSGTISDDTIINVYYTKNAPGHLKIDYVFSDTGTTAAESFEGDYDVGTNYNIPSPSITGYTASVSEISGTMTEEGKYVLVKYNPVNVTVSFDSNGGSTCADINTVYNNNYSFNGVTTKALPKPIKVGYKFIGWYSTSDFANDSIVTESTKVKNPAAHTLYAKWEELKFTITVKHVYEDSTFAADDIVITGFVDEPYSIDSQAIVGCTPDKNNISGSFIATNQVFYITYIGNEYKLTINYKNATTTELIPELASYEANIKYRDSYSVNSPNCPSGYSSCSLNTVSGIMPATPVTIDVLYYETEPIISVTIEWGDLKYQYITEDWNPSTHTYGTQAIVPINTGSDQITVKNNNEANTLISASFKYSSKPAYSTVTGSFLIGGNNASEISDIIPGESIIAKLALYGTMPLGTEGRTFKTGTCTVSIEGGRVYD